MNWKKYRILIIGLLLVLAILVRFYRLSDSGTFFWDQAYDLTRIHEYFVNHKISLIGPISEDGTKVYSSVYYYMMMPWAAILGFSTISTTLGAAIYGVLTVILIWLVIKRNNKNWAFLLMVGILLAIWFPLVETSRWAWNPNLIMFWMALGLWCEQYEGKWWKIVAGLCLGLSIHEHYLAIIAAGVYLAIRKNINLFIGLVLALLPFVFFDLTHPPGLFLSRILYFNQTNSGLSLVGLISNIGNNFATVGGYYTHSSILTGLLLLGVGILIWIDARQNPRNLIYIAPWLAQIGGVAIFNANYQHYFFGGLVFFVVWLAIKRENRLNWIILGVLVLGSALTIYPQITTNPWNKKEWRPNITTVEKIDNWIESQFKKDDLTKVNIAVLGSTDSNTYGWKYRSLLSMKKINFEPKDDYKHSDYLLVVSESSENVLRKDPAIEMDDFRQSKLISNILVDQSDWKVYLFKK